MLICLGYLIPIPTKWPGPVSMPVGQSQCRPYIPSFLRDYRYHGPASS